MRAKGLLMSSKIIKAGAEVASDVAAGTLTIPVDDASAFSEEGGELDIAGTLYTYSTWAPLDDGSGDTITLVDSPPALAQGDDILIYPYSEIKEGLIDLGDGEEGVTAFIYGDIGDRIPDGILEVDDYVRVTVDDESGTWEVVSIGDRTPGVTSITGVYEASKFVAALQDPSNTSRIEVGNWKSSFPMAILMHFDTEGVTDDPAFVYVSQYGMDADGFSAARGAEFRIDGPRCAGGINGGGGAPYIQMYRAADDRSKYFNTVQISTVEGVPGMIYLIATTVGVFGDLQINDTAVVKGFDHGRFSGTTDANGRVTIPHILGTTFGDVALTSGQSSGRSYDFISSTTSDMTVECRSSTGAVLGSGITVNIHWQAWK